MPDSQNEQTPLSEKEQEFVRSYVIDHNATRAYIKAFGEIDEKGSKRSRAALRQAAKKLLTKAHIQNEIRGEEAYICRKNRITPHRVVSELSSIAFSDIGDVFDFDVDGFPMPKKGRDIPYRVRKAIQEIRHTTRTTLRDDQELIVETEVKYKLHPKQPALDKLYAHLGLSPETCQLEAFLAVIPNGPLREEIERLLSSAINTKGKSGGEPDPIPTDNSDEAGQTV
jgi:hypothetical protein